MKGLVSMMYSKGLSEKTNLVMRRLDDDKSGKQNVCVARNEEAFSAFLYSNYLEGFRTRVWLVI